MAQAGRLRRPPPLADPDPDKELGVAPDVLGACRSVSLRIGGPRLTSLGVTSAIRGEGRTTIAVALALIQAADYRRQGILLELDFECPSLADRFGLNPQPGLCELARGEVTIAQALQPAGDGLRIITAGRPAWSASRTMMELLSSGVLQEIGHEGDVVVADLPAVLSSAFGGHAAQAFDQLVFVVRAGITPLPRVREAMATLWTEPAVVLNGTHTNLPAWLRSLIGL